MAKFLVKLMFHAEQCLEFRTLHEIRCSTKEKESKCIDKSQEDISQNWITLPIGFNV